MVIFWRAASYEAKASGLSIPASVLSIADEVIE
jgi:hypothetical protein